MNNYIRAFGYFFLVAFALLACSSKHQVECQCTDLIKQYFECKYLKMINNSNADNRSVIGDANPDYKPDPSIPNNVLNDTFYQNQNLSRMSFDQAMQLFWNIYNETKNCYTPFCDCVSKGVIDRDGHKPSLLFRNASIYPYTKSILSAFINKFKPNLLPYSRLESQFYQTPNLPTLNQFCINYDYSYNRMSYYNNTQTCTDYSISEYLKEYSCEWSAEMINRRYPDVLTNSQMTNLMICGLLPYKNCSIEEKRLVALAFLYKQSMTIPWKNLAAYLDTLISRASTFKPAINFSYAYFSYYNSFIYQFSNDSQTYDVSNMSDFTVIAFNSTQLRIDCRFNMSKQQINLVWFNFTFIFDKSHSYSKFLNMSLINPVMYNSTLTNGTIIKDKNGQNWIQMFYFDYSSSVIIYDFNSNSMIFFYSNQFTLYIPTTLFQKANGFLKNGLFSNIISSVPIGRK